MSAERPIKSDRQRGFLFFEKLIWPELQCQREPLKIVERDVASLTFDVSDEGSMQPRLEG